jgi:microsomal epoxide hydrolase
MAVAQYSQLPKPISGNGIRPFTLKVPKSKVRDMETLIRLSPVGKPTYENLKTDGSLGLNRNWLVETKKHWMESFKWYV